jgi:hypothetical protein
MLSVPDILDICGDDDIIDGGPVGLIILLVAVDEPLSLLAVT